MMPVTYYTEEEYEQLKRINAALTAKVEELAMLRPIWAQGYTSDSIAAQHTAWCTAQVRELLGVKGHTACMARLRELLAKEKTK